MENKKNHGATCVRFSDVELKIMEEAASTTGRSIPWLLKNSFFSKGAIRPMFDKESAYKIRMELNRIGGNINQIAREINSGIKKGWHLEFEECNRLLLEIVKMTAVKFANN